MGFSYLNSNNVLKVYKAAKDYTDKLTKPFPEYARIANNKPYDGIDPNYPKTTDGTTASIVRKTPKRVVQQLPTGKVSNDTDDWLSIVSDFILTKKLLPYANEEYDLIQKCWTFIESSLTFGFTATYTPFVNHDGYFCPDVTGIYWGDVALQPGKKSGYACKYVFVRSWWQVEDIDALIAKESKLSASAKKRGEEYEEKWIVEALKELKDKKTSKDQQARTPIENDRSVETDAIELVTGYQSGIGAKFYTFSPDLNKVVRIEENKDPRGKMPIDWMYGDIDGSNPLGRGVVELLAGIQNLIDSDMQMYQYNRALMLAPPILNYGNTPNSKIRLVPNAVIKITDTSSRIEPLGVDTSAVVNYPQLYQLQQSQLFNLVQSPQSTISTPDAALGQGKTPTALKQQQATISVDDNYIRKMFEAWFENWGETAINLYFAKRSGIEELQLDKDTANRLRKLADKGKFDLEQLTDDDKIMIDYDTATPALKFRIDASTSKMNDDKQQIEALAGLKDALESSQVLSSLIVQRYPEKVLALWNSLVAVSAVEDPEELSIDIEEFKAQQEQEKEMQAQQAAQAEAQAAQTAPEMPMGQPLPELPLEQPLPVDEPTPPTEDEQIALMLRGFGVSDENIIEAIARLDEGQPFEDVLAWLGIAVPAEGVANV